MKKVKESPKLADKKFVGDIKSKRNLKILIFTCVITVGVLFFCCLASDKIQLALREEATTLAAVHSLPFFNFLTRNAVFKYFEKDGDIEQITVHTAGDQHITRLILSEGTTLEQSADGLIVLKALNGEYLIVNTTDRRITVYTEEHRLRDTVKVVSVSRTVIDGDGNVRARLSLGDEVEIVEMAANVTFAPFTGNFLLKISRSSIKNDTSSTYTIEINISVAPDSTVFERRQSDELAITATSADALGVRPLMRIRPSTLYVVENSTRGTLYFDPSKEFFINTVGGWNMSGWPYEPRHFAKFVNEAEVIEVQFENEEGQFMAWNAFGLVTYLDANKTVTAVNPGGTFRLENDANVTANDKNLKLRVDMNASIITEMTEVLQIEELAQGEEISRSFLGAVHKFNGVINKITTKAANLTREDSFVVKCPEDWQIRVPSAKHGLAVRDEQRGIVALITFQKLEIMQAVGTTDDGVEVKVDPGRLFSIIDSYARIKIQDKVANLEGILANVSITPFFV